MPGESTIDAWLMADPEFKAQCARAREASAAHFERRIVDLTDRIERGEIDPKAGAVALNALTWICKVRNRRVYGDKVEVDAHISIGGAIMERLARARGRVIDAQTLESLESQDSSDSNTDDQREAA